MEQNFLKYISGFFENLTKIYGFNIKDEINDGETYCVEYSSNAIVIKLEKYRREFYVTLYNLNNPEKEINLFNLLEYVNQSTLNAPKAKYFRNEIDIEESYRKQLIYLSKIIYENYDVINDFFSNDNYESNVDDLEKFIIKKYSDLFRKV